MGNPISLLIGQLRYTGIAAGINIGATIFGGACPLIVAYLVQQTGKQCQTLSRLSVPLRAKPRMLLIKFNNFIHSLVEI